MTATAYTPNAINQYTKVNAVLTTYDADGNLLTDGVQTCQWDGENRLISVTKADGTQVTNVYDGLSRRVRKTSKKGATVLSDTGFVYDGWNVIAEYNLASGSPALTAVNTWGLDLSNSRQGAGGVGGLLARTTGGATRSYTFDGNGNVSELVNGTGTLAGHYEYGPFGQTTAQIDSDASGAVGSNPYRFSTKPLDAESGLYYYGYRYYNPVDGRWINRDPLGERGGLNRYVVVGNNAVNVLDILGLIETTVTKCEIVLVYGHGDATGEKPHTFKWPDDETCSGSSAAFTTGCGSPASNKLIPPENQLPVNCPDADECRLLNNVSDSQTNYQDRIDNKAMRAELSAAVQAAKQRVADICKMSCCKDKGVTIRFVYSPNTGANLFDKTVEYLRDNPTTWPEKDFGAISNQLKVDCKK